MQTLAGQRSKDRAFTIAPLPGLFQRILEPFKEAVILPKGTYEGLGNVSDNIANNNPLHSVELTEDVSLIPLCESFATSLIGDTWANSRTVLENGYIAPLNLDDVVHRGFELNPPLRRRYGLDISLATEQQVEILLQLMMSGAIEKSVVEDRTYILTGSDYSPDGVKSDALQYVTVRTGKTDKADHSFAVRKMDPDAWQQRIGLKSDQRLGNMIAYFQIKPVR